MKTFFLILFSLFLNFQSIELLGLPNIGGKKIVIYRVIKLCPGTEKKGIVDLKSMKFEKTSTGEMAITATLNLKQDVDSKNGEKASVKAFKCRSFSEQESCEYVTTMNFAKNDICKKLEEKGQFWSDIVAAVTPKIKCPLIKKGVYKITKGTLNVQNLVQLMPMISEGYWQVEISATLKNNKLIACALSGADIQTKASK